MLCDRLQKQILTLIIFFNNNNNPLWQKKDFRNTKYDYTASHARQLYKDSFVLYYEELDSGYLSYEYCRFCWSFRKYQIVKSWALAPRLHHWDLNKDVRPLELWELHQHEHLQTMQWCHCVMYGMCIIEH